MVDDFADFEDFLESGGPDLIAAARRLRAAQHVEFECAICERHVQKDRYRAGNCFEVPPVCRRCTYNSVQQRGYLSSSSGSMPMVNHGSFRDRFITQQIGAVADEIFGLAHRIEWSKRNARL